MYYYYRVDDYSILNEKMVSYTQFPGNHEQYFQFSNSITLNSPKFSNSQIWLVLRLFEMTDHEISILRQKLKYLAILPNMEGAVVLYDDGRGLLQPKIAFHVAENIVFVFDGASQTAKNIIIKFVLYRNPAIIFTSSDDEGVSFSTMDIASFLYFVGENVIIMKMLQIDGCYGVIDRYIIAMAFIYLKRANCEYFSDTLTVLAAFLLAHKMEEDECPGRAMTSLIYQAIRNINVNAICPQGIRESDKQAYLNDIVSCQSQLFEKISYRGLVTREECDTVIAVAPNHPVWKRWRLAFHGGAVRDRHHVWKLQFIQNSGAAFFSTSLENQQKCILCKGNSTYCQSVQGRFTMSSSFHTQQIHLNNVLASVKTASALNNRTFSCSIPQSFQRVDWQDFACNAQIDNNLPWDYLQLLEIENQIENVLANEKYLENLLRCPPF